MHFVPQADEDGKRSFGVSGPKQEPGTEETFGQDTIVRAME
jgi:hypothetical protein